MGGGGGCGAAKDRRPYFVISVVWSAQIVSEWVLVARVRKSFLGPAEISSFVHLVQFKDGGCRVSLRLHLFVSIYLSLLIFIFMFIRSRKR